jgi:hypothetical protein
MGLDMYALTGLDMRALTATEQPAAEVDFEPGKHTVLHTWWKHPNLHGWMENLYYEKGGNAESFNCVYVALTPSDLDRLEADVREGRLPHTEGFFFGRSDGSERDDDLAFIAKARDAIQSGLTVYYTSWW